MESWDVPCGECGALHSRLLMVHQYVVSSHTLEFDRTNEFCSSCAIAEEKRRTYGQVEEWALEGFAQLMEQHYGERLDVRWLQGDEHKWLFHVRRLTAPSGSAVGE